MCYNRLTGINKITNKRKEELDMYILSLGNMEFVTEIGGTEVAYDCYFSTQTLARVSGKTLSLVDK